MAEHVSRARQLAQMCADNGKAFDTVAEFVAIDKRHTSRRTLEDYRAELRKRLRAQSERECGK